MNQEINIKLSKFSFAPEYIPLLRDNNPTKLFYGSRNSAKSDFACVKKIIRCVTLPYFKCLMVRKFKSDVRGSIFETVLQVIKRMGLSEFFTTHENRMEIVFNLNGNKFIPLGLYESAGAEGTAKSKLNPTDALVDELDQATEDEFEDMDLSLRGSDDLETIGVFNTKNVDENHWIFKRWFIDKEKFEKIDGSHSYVKSKRRNTTIIHTTYKMNPFVTSQIIDKFDDQKEFTPEKYDVHGLGLMKVVKQSNMALPKFNRADHVSDEVGFNPDALVYLAWDFNRLPHHTVSLWQFGGVQLMVGIDERNHYLWNMPKEFCLEDTSVKGVTIEIIAYLKLKGYSSKRVAIVCDYSGNARRDHGAKSDINKIKTELKRAGFEVQDRTIVNPSVLASLDFLNDAFGGYVRISKMNDNHADKILKLQIHPSCSFHIADFEKTKTDDSGQLLKVKKTETLIEDGVKVKRSYQVRGHGVDNTRYIMTSIFRNEYSLHKSANV